MKTIYLLCLALGSSAFAQTITFKGCPNLFENQTYTFTKTGVDASNKNIYITIPVTGDQECGGLGTCEFKIQWNNSQSRWEFLGDSGNGDFADPYLIYSNSAGNNSAANPPSNSVGTWVENTVITEGDCGGNLTTVNSTITGDVHTTTLAIGDVSKSKIQIFPNPVIDAITISGVENAQKVEIYNTVGQLVKAENFKNKINVSSLSSGIYILKIKTKDAVHEFKFVKK